MHQASTINPVALRHTIDVLKDRGKSPDMLCRGLGIELSELDAPDFRISTRQALVLAQRAVQIEPDPILGHWIGRKRTLISCGLLGLAMLSGACVEQLCVLCQRYPGAMGSTLSVRIDHPPQGGLHLVAEGPDMDADMAALFVDELFAALVQLLRLATGLHFVPEFIEFIELTRPAPSDQEALTAFFQAPMRFGQAANRMSIDAHWALARIPTADHVVHSQITRLLDLDLDKQKPSDICITIERLIAARLASAPKLAELADLLSTSERTLRRKLADHGTTYQALADQVYRSHAIALVQQSELAIEHIASTLGFADVRSFRRAFKRWTGTSPTVQRKHMSET